MTYGQALQIAASYLREVAQDDTMYEVADTLDALREFYPGVEHEDGG